MIARTNGAWRIFLYNWPTYAATWGGALIAMILAPRVAGPLAPLVVTGASIAALWSAFSLVVSHWIYDRSPLAGATWARALVPAGVERWASLDAGLDAEVALESVLSGTCVARLDLYDGTIVRAPSVERARTLTPRVHRATPSRATALALEDESCDLVAVVFTAHEIRDVGAREAFFREVRRALRRGGRMLLVEHVRDVANFCAFGPGFFHFQPRGEWLRLARLTGLSVAVEERVTPWVMALALDKVDEAAP